MGSLGYYNNSLFSSIYNSVLVFRVACTFYLKVFFKKVNIKKLILALAVFKVIGVGGLVYIGLIGLGGFYREVFRQRLTVII